MKKIKTFVAKAETVKREWLLVDAEGVTLGRLATEVASILKGKRKPTYTPHVDVGDYVVVINAEKVRVSGRKLTDKVYYRHSGYPGGIKATVLKEMLARKPEFVIEKAVKGMLSRNPLSRAMFRKLKVYAGHQHPHEAQQPKVIAIKGIKAAGQKKAGHIKDSQKSSAAA